MKSKKARKARVKAVAIPVAIDSNQPRPGSVLRVIGHPIHIMADQLHLLADGKVEKKHLRYIVGGFMMVTGSSMAVGATMIHIGHLGHIIVDLVAYAIHGCGAVPYITHVVRRFELEG